MSRLTRINRKTTGNVEKEPTITPTRVIRKTEGNKIATPAGRVVSSRDLARRTEKKEDPSLENVEKKDVVPYQRPMIVDGVSVNDIIQREAEPVEIHDIRCSGCQRLIGNKIANYQNIKEGENYRSKKSNFQQLYDEMNRQYKEFYRKFYNRYVEETVGPFTISKETEIKKRAEESAMTAMRVNNLTTETIYEKLGLKRECCKMALLSPATYYYKATKPQRERAIEEISRATIPQKFEEVNIKGKNEEIIVLSEEERRGIENGELHNCGLGFFVPIIKGYVKNRMDPDVYKPIRKRVQPSDLSQIAFSAGDNEGRYYEENKPLYRYMNENMNEIRSWVSNAVLEYKG